MVNFNYTFFKYLTIYLYFCAKTLGLVPYTFNIHTKCFERSKILEVYTVSAGCFVIYTNYITRTNVLNKIDHNFKLIAPTVIVTVMEFIEVIIIAINYLLVLILNQKIIDAKNKLMLCGLELLFYSKMKYKNLSLKYFLIFVFKEILLKWIIFILNVIAVQIVTNNHITNIEAVLNNLVQFITYLVSSHFIANLMNSIHLYDIINGELYEIMQELKRKDATIRTTRILHLCDTLDRLCSFHWQTTRCFKQIVAISSIPMLMQIGYLFSNIVIYTYMELSMIILNFTNRVAPENLRMIRICGLFNVILSLIQLFSYTILSSRVVHKSRKAGQLLSLFVRLGIVDERLLRTVESFSLSLEQNKFEISICGLFVVNYELMYAMAASMTSYLIILVQYQLEFSKSA